MDRKKVSHSVKDARPIKHAKIKNSQRVYPLSIYKHLFELSI